MKIINYPVILISLSFLMYLSACDSASYETEEVDIPKDTSGITRYNEIKHDVGKPIPEIKEETQKQETVQVSNKPAVTYTVQVGAYAEESNAQDMFNKVKVVFYSDAYYDLNGNIYQVRIGKVSSTDEALTLLAKVQGAGYSDAFITKVNK